MHRAISSIGVQAWKRKPFDWGQTNRRRSSTARRAIVALNQLSVAGLTVRAPISSATSNELARRRPHSRTASLQVRAQTELVCLVTLSFASNSRPHEHQRQSVY